MKLDILNKNGESTGRKVDLPDDIFNIEVNEHALYLDVKRILAEKRSGTHKSKERAEISGSTKKLRRQKGTGAARVGSIKSPVFRGGGRIFGPRPRTYDMKVNKKVQKLARKSALSFKAKENRIVILEDMQFEKPRTKDFVQVINSLKLQDKKILFVSSAGNDANVSLSLRNIPKVNECQAGKISSYIISNCYTLVVTESGLEELKNAFKN